MRAADAPSPKPSISWLPLEQIVSEALDALQPAGSPDFDAQGAIVDRLDAID